MKLLGKRTRPNGALYSVKSLMHKSHWAVHKQFDFG